MTIQPLLMKRKTAAAYVDMSVASFERAIASGQFPTPVTIGKTEYWYKKSMDRAVAIIAGDIDSDYSDMKVYQNAN